MSPGKNVRLLVCLLLLGLPGVCHADQWLVYLGGGLEPVEGGWTERRGQVVFTQRGGTLVSVPYPDVDLAASAFITWQLGGRRRIPPRATLPEETPGAGSPADCRPARIVSLRGAETFVLEAGGAPETVHVACLDAPEVEHKFAELGWFGRAALSAIRLEVSVGDEVCLTELEPAQRDSEGHRVVYLTLPDGDDYTAKIIGEGLGLLRSGSCSRAAAYRRFEDAAIAAGRGLWGTMSEKAALAAIHQADAVGGGPPPRRARSAGGG